MKLKASTWAVGVLALGLVASYNYAADEAGMATTQPAEKPAKKAAFGGPRLTSPWNKLTSLSEDQKAKILAIHAEAVAETKKIEEKEDADIMALLTEEQHAEVKAVEEKAIADRKLQAAEMRKERAAEKKGAKAPTTAPAN